MLDKAAKRPQKQGRQGRSRETAQDSGGRRCQGQARGSGEKERAAQLGARKYPEPPFPKQHHPKPGHEHEIEPAPLYDAPFYIGSKKLDGKVALITGGDSGIGRAVAVLFAREGADVAISYLTEHEDAKVTKKAVEAEGRRCIPISGDVAKREHCMKAVAAHREGARQARRAGQQRRLPDPFGELRGSDARAFRHDAEDQSLRLFPHGAGGGPAHEAGLGDHQHRLGHRHRRQRRNWSTIR